MPHNAYIVGFMASGKSSIGKRLSSRLGRKLYDTDLEVEKRTGMSIPEIFSRLGEEKFREEESRLLRAIPQEGSIVVTGGGLPCFHDNMAYMNRTGITFYLEVPESILASRLQEEKNRIGRPLLQGLDKDGIIGLVREKLAERAPVYRQAAYRLYPHTESFSELCRRVSDATALN